MSSKKSKAQVSPGTQGASVPWLGIDIGGANLKLAHNQSPIPDRNASERDTGVGKTRVWTKSIPFPMWKESKNLAATLARAIDDFPEFHGIAVTMTGELADCFATRAEGVACILEQVTRLFPAPLVYVYCVDGSWRSPSQAARDPWQAAASNWHALANWSRRLLPKRKSKGRSAKDLGGEELGVVVDIGSTTIDVIGISDQKVLTRSRTDSDRLKRRELIYTGVERSNLSGLLRSVPLHGKRCPVMNELFATTRDAYLWLRYLDDSPGDSETADGKPATREHARYRLARLVGEDGSTMTDADLDAIGEQVLARQSGMLRRSLERVLGRISTATNSESVSGQKSNQVSNLIASGHGGFLLREALEGGEIEARFGLRTPVWLDEHLGEGLSRVAPAFAVATLACEAGLV